MTEAASSPPKSFDRLAAALGMYAFSPAAEVCSTPIAVVIVGDEAGAAAGRALRVVLCGIGEGVG